MDFVTWALDPKRTDEEAFFAELLTEWGFEAWCSKHIKGWFRDWRDGVEKRRQRRLNPAHRAELEPQEVEKAAQMLPTLSYLRLGNHEDRPVRDLTGLQFVPQLKDLQIEHSEIPDFSPVAALSELEELHFWDAVVEDLRPIARLTKLKKLWAHVDEPWPLLDGWSGLTQLELFSWYGNMFLLEGLGPFPKMNWAMLRPALSQTPLRDAARLPEMPAVRRMLLSGVHRLDGIERYPLLQNLKLETAPRDLTPVTALRHVTHLELQSEEEFDLGVLCRMPELRSLKVHSHQPQEWFVLTEAAKLHEVETSWCEANTREVVTLQEVLPSWDADFKLPAPRPLPEPGYFALEQQQWQKRIGTRHDKDWDGNQGMQSAESDWLERQMQAALDQHFGKLRWGKAQYYQVHVTAVEAADRLPEIVTVIRQVLATCRHHHDVTIHIGLLKPELPKKPRPPESEEDRLKREIQEHREDERRWQEQAQLRERQHRLQQLRQDGVKINPEEFAPEPEPPQVEDLDADNEVYDDEDEGEPHLLAEQYDLYATVNEREVLVHVRALEIAERLLNRRIPKREPPVAN